MICFLNDKTRTPVGLPRPWVFSNLWTNGEYFEKLNKDFPHRFNGTIIAFADDIEHSAFWVRNADIIVMSLNDPDPDDPDHNLVVAGLSIAAGKLVFLKSELKIVQNAVKLLDVAQVDHESDVLKFLEEK